MPTKYGYRETHAQPVRFVIEFRRHTSIGTRKGKLTLDMGKIAR
jgi:hypothetical protein